MTQYNEVEYKIFHNKRQLHHFSSCISYFYFLLNNYFDKYHLKELEIFQKKTLNLNFFLNNFFPFEKTNKKKKKKKRIKPYQTNKQKNKSSKQFSPH